MTIKKTLCELSKKEIKELEKEIWKVVKKPKYMCGKCARVSGGKKILCDPQKCTAD